MSEERIELSAFTERKEKKKKAAASRGKDYAIEATGALPSERTVLIRGALK